MLGVIFVVCCPVEPPGSPIPPQVVIGITGISADGELRRDGSSPRGRGDLGGHVAL